MSEMMVVMIMIMLVVVMIMTSAKRHMQFEIMCNIWRPEVTPLHFIIIISIITTTTTHTTTIVIIIKMEIKLAMEY